MVKEVELRAIIVITMVAIIEEVIANIIIEESLKLVAMLHQY